MVTAGATRNRPAARRRVIILVVVLGLAVGTACLTLSGVLGSPAAAKAGSVSTYQRSTAVVTRRSLVSQMEVDATLGDNGAYTVVDQAAGTITWLPQIGQAIRQGQVMYRVSGVPVVLLYGQVPAWESLSEGMIGPDVGELNADLVRLGYVTAAELGPSVGWDYFSAATAGGIEGLQARLGLAVTGTLPLGQAVFLPSSAKVTALGASTVLGGPAAPGTAVLTASSTVPVVTIALSADQQTEVKSGDHVTVTLPDGTSTPGIVASVGTVATTPPDGSGGPTTPTIPVLVTLSDPDAAGSLDQAPVTVAITTASVSSVLVVPVDALLAQPAQGNGEAGGEYAVEVTGPGGQHLETVRLGLFDDAAGLVQVAGPGVTAGQHVVVPAI